MSEKDPLGWRGVGCSVAAALLVVAVLGTCGRLWWKLVS